MSGVTSTGRRGTGIDMQPNMTTGAAEGQMDALRFVVRMLALAAAFMAARYLAPHLISGIAVYVAVALCALAMFGAVVGVIRG